jgi:hypothetical protein
VRPTTDGAATPGAIEGGQDHPRCRSWVAWCNTPYFKILNILKYDL